MLLVCDRGPGSGHDAAHVGNYVDAHDLGDVVMLLCPVGLDWSGRILLQLFMHAQGAAHCTCVE